MLPAGSTVGALYHKLQTQSSAPEDVRNYHPRPVELIIIINKLLLSHLVGRLYYIYIYTYLLTPCCRVLLEQLTGLQLVKKFPHISRNPKFHYRTHKRPPPVSILGQPSPVHIPTSHLLEIHPNIIHPSTPRSPQWYIYIYISVYLEATLS